MAFCILDVKHALALAAGERFDGKLHHEPHGHRPCALWIPEPAGDDENYFLKDAAHGMYLTAPDGYDGSVYHEAGRDCLGAQWSFFPMYEGPGGALAVTIKDRRHGMAIVAGDDADGHVYHEHPNGRMNAFWTLVPVNLE